ncbi:hypothetical protein IV203_015467 [Nitzschia inconspicua]|uniref:Uncharacterized protein n=1 Tax=Nitzschia inconspicua TaxID=303405 RepID=A0A9K3K5R8_9STRA|nr:hypothetical protein IV203_020298 [Nitzschia inconspicua]KAG7358878.1 hypothetical protein IV203_015467 [Nitzschia inconspicua]
MHPRLTRALYRSFLRASHVGKHPEVFGKHGAAVFAHHCNVHDDRVSLALPVDASQVRKILKGWFRRPSPALNDDSLTNRLCREIKSNPLDVLRQVHKQEVMLYSPTSPSPSPIQNQLKKNPLPIFDYDQLAALPGEQFQTLFLEPRYTEQLLPMLLDSPSAISLFLLRSLKASSQATVVQLLSHQHVTLPLNSIGTSIESNNDATTGWEPKRMFSGVAVTCVAGPRVVISKETIIPMSITDAQADCTEDEGNRFTCWSQSTAPLFVAEDVQIAVDRDLPLVNPTILSTRHYILNLVERILAFYDSDLGDTLVQTGFGLPPLDPESFSFWALRFVLRRDDMKGRQFWMHNCHSTTERLQYVIIQLEAIVDAQAEDEEEERVGMSRWG